MIKCASPNERHKPRIRHIAKQHGNHCQKRNAKSFRFPHFRFAAAGEAGRWRVGAVRKAKGGCGNADGCFGAFLLGPRQRSNGDVGNGGRRQRLLWSQKSTWNGGVILDQVRRRKRKACLLFLTTPQGDDVVVEEMCNGDVTDFQWLVVDVNATIRSLSIESAGTMNCCSASVEVVARLVVTTSCTGGSDTVDVERAFLWLRNAGSKLKCATINFEPRFRMGGNGTLSSLGEFAFNGTISPVPGFASDSKCRCSAKQWPGQMLGRQPVEMQTVLEAAQITLSRDATLFSFDPLQTVMFSGTLRSMGAGLRVTPDVGRSEIVFWTSLAANSSFDTAINRFHPWPNDAGCIMVCPTQTSNDAPGTGCVQGNGRGTGLSILACPAAARVQLAACDTFLSTCVCDNGMAAPSCSSCKLCLQTELKQRLLPLHLRPNFQVARLPESSSEASYSLPSWSQP